VAISGFESCVLLYRDPVFASFETSTSVMFQVEVFGSPFSLRRWYAASQPGRPQCERSYLWF